MHFRGRVLCPTVGVLQGSVKLFIQNRAGLVSFQVIVTEQQGNLSWCERLYDDKAAHLLLYGRALGLSHSEAEDVVQETFVALLLLSAVPEEPGHYVFRAVRN